MRDTGISESPYLERTSRRAAIKRTLALGGAYVAPVILGSATSASAAVVSPIPCSTPSCVASCGSATCYCLPSLNGGNVCVTGYCGALGCKSSAECAEGWLCVAAACCFALNALQTGTNGFGGACMPPCGVAAPAPIPEG